MTLDDATPTLVFEDGIYAQGFTMLPNALLKARNLTSSAKMLYAFLLFYARQEGQCFPGYDTLATDMGMTEKSTRKYMQELESVNLVRQKRRGLGLHNIYIIRDLRTVQFTGPDRKEIPMRAGKSTAPKPKELPTTKTQVTKTQPTNDKAPDLYEQVGGRSRCAVCKGWDGRHGDGCRVGQAEAAAMG